MLSDAKFVLAGHAISSLDLLLGAALLLCIAAFLLAIARRNHRVSVHPSPVTDEIIIQLGRIADAVERIAYQPLQNNISALPGTSSYPPKAVAAPPEPEPRPVPYSMFGRER